MLAWVNISYSSKENLLYKVDAKMYVYESGQNFSYNKIT